MKSESCPYREWHWHDGGPDYLCTLKHTGCENSYDDWYQCDYIKQIYKLTEIIIKQKKERENEDVDEWATKLSETLSTFSD